jgi:hypothetical protein
VECVPVRRAGARLSRAYIYDCVRQVALVLKDKAVLAYRYLLIERVSRARRA